MLTRSLSTLLLLSATALQAHWPWIEPATPIQPARAYFGVFPAERMAGPQLKAMQAARFWSFNANGSFTALTPQPEANALSLGTHPGVVMSYPFGVYAGHGPASLIYFTAKAFREVPTTTSPETLPLDILAATFTPVKTGQPATFRLLRNGQPLASANVFAYTATQGESHSAALKAAKAAGHDHAHEAKDAKSDRSGEIPAAALKATTNAKGEFVFTIPAPGSYQLHVTVREATPGTYQGKAYETVTLVSTLRLNVR